MGAFKPISLIYIIYRKNGTTQPCQSSSMDTMLGKQCPQNSCLIGDLSSFLPVALSTAETFRLPSESISKVTAI